MLELKKEQFFKAIEQVAKQNLLDTKEIFSIIENSVKKSFHSKYDPDAELELIMEPTTQKFELVNHSKLVVDEAVPQESMAIEINIKDAKKIDDDIKVGDMISEIVDFDSYSRSIANQIKQLITQNVKEKRKAAIYAKHKSLKGQMVSAIVTSLGRSHALFVLDDGTTSFMPPNMKNPKIKLKIGERVKVYVEDVLKESKDAQVIVSNGSKQSIKRYLELEVPEILDGIVEIMAISRIPGERTKVAVRSHSEDIDAVGTIIGAQGKRINAIISKLEGEKIDIIPFSNDVNQFVVSAISPAKAIAIIDKKNDAGEIIDGHKIIITPNRHQTLAIGRGGLNVRLAVELTNNRIDIISHDEAIEKELPFDWNGNITKDQLWKIEEGIKIVKDLRSNNSRSRHSNNSFNSNNFNNEFNEDIASFNEDIKSKPSIQINSDFEDPDFSDADLEKMQADFEFDNEIVVTDFEPENEE